MLLDKLSRMVDVSPPPTIGKRATLRTGFARLHKKSVYFIDDV